MTLRQRSFVDALDSLFWEVKNSSLFSDVAETSFSGVKNDSLVSEVHNGSFSSDVQSPDVGEWRTFVKEVDVRPNISLINDNVTQLTDANSDTTVEWIARVSRNTVQFVTNVTETNVVQTSENGSSDTETEVTINRPEVYEEFGIGTAEKVVIGAAVVVAILAVTAILLRLCRPACSRHKWVEKTSIQSAFGIEVSDSKLSAYTNIEVASNSSTGSSSQSNDWSQSTGSNPSTDWSDLSSDVQKSFEPGDTEPDHEPEPEMPKRDVTSLPVMPGGPGPAHLLRSIASEDRLSAKSSPLPQRRMNDEVLSVISTHSLEPLRFEQAYRNRWDDQWDPYGSLPRGNLSHHSHPSESRLSLNSLGSHSSSAIFPIPSRETVKQLNLDKSSRYPSNLKLPTAMKKEKHVRMSTPTDH